MKLKNPITGIEMNYYEQGSGRPMILIHGLSGNTTRWDRTVPILAKSYRVVTYDLRGHGLSQKTPDLDCSFPSHVQDLAGLMDALGIDRAVIAGHSMGGMIAQHFALEYPQRVERMILVATTACLMPAPIMRFLIRLFSGILLLIPFLVAFFIRRKTRSKPRELFPELDNPELDFADRPIARCVYAIINMDIRERMRTLNLPTLVISSTQDELIPPARVRALADLIPGAQFTAVENLTHYVPLEQPVKVAAVVQEFAGAQV